ncbi:alpha/beta hydrolase family protein [Erythrobacter rubeus]|uniref:alpha/beta hydrolase family protein n=1 Tax=Erythrobacter rubeus TaxID=2760803 RepID=UPI002E27C949|nr:alpha/beta hydrolase [Erythrobacter rubeus]
MVGFLSLAACTAPQTDIRNAEAAGSAASFSPADCAVGIYGDGTGDFVAITQSAKGYQYSFSDGVIGDATLDRALLECGKNSVLVDQRHVWNEIPIREQDTRFTSGDAKLAGRLLEPNDAGEQTPLVVYAHGSEPTGWIGSVRDPYQMVGRGISVFVYDKRGTGQSEGKYSQNFPRLAGDLVAAANEAKRLAQGGFGRFGLVGLSQGGWIAPLAAEQAQADFIAIGYGLVADIREEDADQVQRELSDAGYSSDVLRIARKITDVTARVASSDYTSGLDELAEFQRKYSSEAWFPVIRGSYTGVLLNTSTDELRERGVPQFNDLDIDWSLNPINVLREVDVPQLWVLAGEDREAPIGLTINRLQTLRDEGSDISIYMFPDTDHGMREFDQEPDGTRQLRRVTSGYYDLIADYVKGRPGSHYGRSVLVEDR